MYYKQITRHIRDQASLAPFYRYMPFDRAASAFNLNSAPSYVPMATLCLLEDSLSPWRFAQFARNW